VAPARHGACKQDSWLLAIRHADTPGGHRGSRFAEQPAGSAVPCAAHRKVALAVTRHASRDRKTADARGRSTSAKTAVTRERRSSPATAGTVRRVRVCGRTREDVRRQLTKILEQADRGIPVAAVSWAIAKYPVYRLGHGVRPERKPRTCQGYEGVAPDVKLVRQRPMAVVAAGQVAVVAPPATS
jgi:hypothetical protein